MFKKNKGKYETVIFPKANLGEYLLEEHAKQTGQKVKIVWSK